eukprot:CAMPEP_0179006664 /NCGR_PEP_ID=MMETSP0795-20121207/14690_1 /TAXON_ID=88552 /ORGANISM="Amoebophrya sp., Strain Ameob2" /LENGTH=151 /DNA_ID=CAMNT_0020701471 /DNA_START=175 /DNA_END=627 /DNA_ORIENTATION=-
MTVIASATAASANVTSHPLASSRSSQQQVLSYRVHGWDVRPLGREHAFVGSLDEIALPQMEHVVLRHHRLPAGEEKPAQPPKVRYTGQQQVHKHPSREHKSPKAALVESDRSKVPPIVVHHQPAAHAAAHDGGSLHEGEDEAPEDVEVHRR